ncbi:MAG: DinB family protein [Pirellulaceae bacterium]|nr:DinB family protein [Pirellulaceae bacterium]
MSTAVDLIARMNQHRLWVNANLLAAAAPLADEALRREFAIGQGSIYKSLLHLYAAEYVWLAALVGDESAVAPGDVAGKLPGNQLGDSPIASLAELRERWTELAARWKSYVRSLTPEALDEPVWRKNSLTGQRSASRRSDVLLHVCTHAQYTTAQVVNMLRQLGVEKLPDVMLIVLARQEAASA